MLEGRVHSRRSLAQEMATDSRPRAKVSKSLGEIPTHLLMAKDPGRWQAVLMEWGRGS